MLERYILPPVKFADIDTNPAMANANLSGTESWCFADLGSQMPQQNLEYKSNITKKDF